MYFFFSSRRRHTRSLRDWSSDVCSSDLGGENEAFEGKVVKGKVTGIENDLAVIDVGLKSEGRVPLREFAAPGQKRSEERRVGKECRSRWSRDHYTKKGRRERRRATPVRN